MGGDGMADKKILWWGDEIFKPIQAQILALMKIFCCEIQIERRRFSVSIEEVVDILNNTDFAGMVVTGNMVDIITKFATFKGGIDVPVYYPEFIPAERQEDADLMIAIMPFCVQQLHFKQFNTLNWREMRLFTNNL
jgi:hypothetical protein